MKKLKSVIIAIVAALLGILGAVGFRGEKPVYQIPGGLGVDTLVIDGTDKYLPVMSMRDGDRVEYDLYRNDSLWGTVRQIGDGKYTVVLKTHECKR